MVYFLHKLFGKTDFQTFSCSKNFIHLLPNIFQAVEVLIRRRRILKKICLTIQKSIKIEKFYLHYFDQKLP